MPVYWFTGGKNQREKNFKKSLWKNQLMAQREKNTHNKLPVYLRYYLVRKIGVDEYFYLRHQKQLIRFYHSGCSELMCHSFSIDVYAQDFDCGCVKNFFRK